MKLAEVHASDVIKYRDCKRKWYLESVCGEKPPASDAQANGTATHKHLEAWLKHGTMPPNDPENMPAQWARALIRAKRSNGQPYLPEPGPGLVTEEPFSMPTYEGGPTWVTYGIDWRDERSRPVYFGDHKTTSRLGLAKSPEKLLTDPQFISYAFYLMTVHQQKSIHGRWGYVEKSTLRTKVVDVDAHFDKVAHQWKHCVDTVREMADLAASEPHWGEVEGTRAACSMFGGCPFRDRCGVGKGSRDMEQPRLISKLRDKMPINEALPAPTESSGLAALKAQLKAEKTAPSPLDDPDSPEAQAALRVAEAAGIVPPDAPAPRLDEVPEEKPKKEPKAKKPRASAEVAPPLTLPPPSGDGHGPSDGDGAGSAPPPEAPKRRSTDSELVLFIDCRPDKGAMFDEVLDAGSMAYVLETDLCAEHLVGSFDAIPGGEGLLARRFEDKLMQLSAPTAICLRTKSRFSSAVIDVLIAHADAVVSPRSY